MRLYWVICFNKKKVTDERTYARNNDYPLYIIMYISTSE
jgi:hypothetical protein